ncbi:MAG: DNA topoisomerase (ATP-hydrolyzing) subunit B [Armatimonadetes bacterium]|nr:DNA topoisomerase (ATP-hydrolyzing) subunit B [Armatimonadota bacterium]
MAANSEQAPLSFPDEPGEEQVYELSVGESVEQASSVVEGEYTAEQLTVLQGLEAVRVRPAMYIGDVFTKGLHHLFVEVTDNAVDEAMAGHCDTIDVVLHEDNSLSVQDNGRGIPVEIHPDTGRPGVEVVMTMLHAGGKFGSGGYRFSGGLHGVGVSVVNALSEWLEVEVARDGWLHHQRFERGVPVKDLEKVKKVNYRGTKVRWLADHEIFGEFKYEYHFFTQRLRELAYLNPSTRFHFSNEVTGETFEFFYKRGIAELVEFLNESKDPIHKPIYFRNAREDTEVEVALQYHAGYQATIFTYANNIHTHEGGTHLSGFKTAMTRVMNQYARKAGLLKEKDANFTGDDVLEGLTSVVAVKLLNPQFEGQTKSKLGNLEMQGLVNSIVGEGFTQFLEENPSIARKIIDKAVTAQRVREAARKQAELVRRQSALEGGSLPGKLYDCTERDPSKSELFLVEGESAGGSAKGGRDRRTQAILTLKGKVLNVEKARLDKALENAEIRALIASLGTGIAMNGQADNNGGEAASKFDLSKLRYHRIILMTDADVDGQHIRTLLLTLFFRYMRPLIDEGHIYIAKPPLFRIRVGKNEQFYAQDEEERDRILKDVKTKNIAVTRFKGLGEMDADDLAETTMDPTKRAIVKVTLEDGIEADRLFSLLMGDKVEPRRAFIEKHATEVTEVDWHY